MSEPRFELLDSYSLELDREADSILPPMSPAEVRRAGMSRYRRRLVVLLVILVCVALAAAGLVLTNLTSGRAAPDWATTASATPAPQPTTTVTTTPSTSVSPSTTDATSSTTTKTVDGVPSWALCGPGVSPTWALEGTSTGAPAANPMTLVLCRDELVVSTPGSEPATYFVKASTLYGVTRSSTRSASSSSTSERTRRSPSVTVQRCSRP